MGVVLGKNGVQLKTYALGDDNSPVTPEKYEDAPKSIGRSVTPPKDIETPEQVWKIYIGIAEEISEILHSKGLYAATVQVHTRDTNLKIKEFSRTLQSPINTSILIAKQGMRLFEQNYNWNLPLRSVGLRVQNLKGENVAFQQSIFGCEKSEEQAEKIENSILEVRKKFGRQSLKRGTSCSADK